MTYFDATANNKREGVHRQENTQSQSTCTMPKATDYLDTHLSKRKSGISISEVVKCNFDLMDS